MEQDSVRQKITAGETHFRTAVSESVMEDFSEVINWIIDHIGQPAIGSVHESMLTEAQFQAVRGVGWILADGRNVAGSTYETITGNVNVVDLRGLHCRAKNNGRSDGNQNPQGDLPLGGVQLDEYKAHVHTATQADNFDSYRQAFSNGTSDRDAGGLRLNAETSGFANLVKTLGNSNPPSTQQLVKSVFMNLFIRIN